MKSGCLRLVWNVLGACALAFSCPAEPEGQAATSPGLPPLHGFTSRANSAPRKVVLGSALANFSGPVGCSLRGSCSTRPRAGRRARILEKDSM